MTIITGSAAIQSSILFDKAADTRTEKDILKYIKHVTVAKNKPGSLLGKLGFKKEIQYSPMSLAKLNDLREYLHKSANHNSKTLNVTINKMMFKMPVSSANDYSCLGNVTARPAENAPKHGVALKDEIIFINSCSKVEKRFNLLSQSEAYKRIDNIEEKRTLMSKNNLIVHQDKNVLIVEPKINLFVNTAIRTTSNTHHYKAIIERAYNFAKECQLSIDDTIDQMYRALKHNGVNTRNLDIQFEAKECDEDKTHKHPANMQYNPTESAFIINKQVDAKVVLGDFNEQPFVLHRNLTYYRTQPPSYDEIDDLGYATINHHSRLESNPLQNRHIVRSAYV